MFTTSVGYILFIKPLSICLFFNVKSNLLNTRHDVPQGSILGPLLFLIYVKDLFVACPDCLCLLFADDTSLVFSGKNVEHLSYNINKTL